MIMWFHWLDWVAAAETQEGRISRRESSPVIRARAHELRHEDNSAEARLWQALRGRRLLGLRFRRQFAVGRFIADFWCSEYQLIVEVDGGVHTDPEVAPHDRLRDEWLRARGITIIRLSADLVLTDVGQCLYRIRTVITSINSRGSSASD